MANDYSRQWFPTFMDTVPQKWTALEVDGVARRLPLPAYRRILDVCCGTGRHASLLEARGYEVTGLDRDEAALDRARRNAPKATFIQLDQRELRQLSGYFDAVLILWQSFGYFDVATNDRILADIAALLRPGGRFLVDLFHPESLVATQQSEIPALGLPDVVIRSALRGDRLESTIRYPDGEVEKMDFELYSPETLRQRAGRVGLSLLEQCCWWEEGRPPDPTVRRYQSVFERL